eukprot:16430750-Heterocapsa_arctica.AAC.1
MGFDGWWHCTKCEARGPALNNKFCIAYTHKRWNNTGNDNDHNVDYPGQKVRKYAYNRMVEHQKDKIFQEQEAADAIRNTKKMDKQEQENNQLH